MNGFDVYERYLKEILKQANNYDLDSVTSEKYSTSVSYLNSMCADINDFILLDTISLEATDEPIFFTALNLFTSINIEDTGLSLLNDIEDKNLKNMVVESLGNLLDDTTKINLDRGYEGLLSFDSPVACMSNESLSDSGNMSDVLKGVFRGTMTEDDSEEEDESNYFSDIDVVDKPIPRYELEDDEEEEDEDDSEFFLDSDESDIKSVPKYDLEEDDEEEDEDDSEFYIDEEISQKPIPKYDLDESENDEDEDEEYDNDADDTSFNTLSDVKTPTGLKSSDKKLTWSSGDGIKNERGNSSRITKSKMTHTGNKKDNKPDFDYTNEEQSLYYEDMLADGSFSDSDDWGEDLDNYEPDDSEVISDFPSKKSRVNNRPCKNKDIFKERKSSISDSFEDIFEDDTDEEILLDDGSCIDLKEGSATNNSSLKTTEDLMAEAILKISSEVVKTPSAFKNKLKALKLVEKDNLE